jgi:hypothetical protein
MRVLSASRRAALAAALCCIPLAGRAQTTGAAPDSAGFQPSAAPGRLPASPLLAPDHWAVRAAWRAENLGLVHGFLPAQRAVPRLVVARALEQAAAAALRRDSRTAAMAAGWVRRFREEFREADPEKAPRRSLRLLGGSFAGEYERWTGRVQPGGGLYAARRTVRPLPDVSTGRGRESLALGIGDHLAFSVESSLKGRRSTVPRWDARATVGAFALAIGREHVGWGPGVGGAIVLDGAVIPRAEVSTATPLHGGGVLRWLGPVSLHTFAARLGEPQRGRPYFWGMRAAVQPHDRLTIGVNRASIFGGDSIATPTTFGNVARMLVGHLSRDFENQVVSADFRYRLPTERVLPLVAYLEWGSEDESGGWWKVAGRMAGAYVPAFPSLPELSAGVEYAGFAKPCCGNPPWYLHGSQSGGWVYGDRPLGHPLGGEGWETAAWAGADVLDARLRLRGRAFLRERSARGFDRPERAGNLYAPERAGRSTGGTLEAAFRASRRAELTLSAFRDAGSGWSEQRVKLSAAALF